MNSKKGTVSAKSHHCSYCNKPLTNRCVTQGHVAHCEVCHTRFGVVTGGGCGQHSYANGGNLLSKQSRSKHPKYIPYELKLKEKEEAEKNAQEAAELARQTEERLKLQTYDTDWKKIDEPKYKKDKVAAEKQKQKKKQPMAPSLKSYMSTRG